MGKAYGMLGYSIGSDLPRMKELLGISSTIEIKPISAIRHSSDSKLRDIAVKAEKEGIERVLESTSTGNNLEAARDLVGVANQGYVNTKPGTVYGEIVHQKPGGQYNFMP